MTSLHKLNFSGGLRIIFFQLLGIIFEDITELVRWHYVKNSEYVGCLNKVVSAIQDV